MPLKILICEDNADASDIVQIAARMSWPNCETAVARTGYEAIRMAFEIMPDLVILDLSLPEMDGFEVCKQLRRSLNAPILILSGREATAYKVRAFDLGADDYLTKPFDVLELIARLKALLRRTGVQPDASRVESEEIVLGDLVLNTATHEVRVKGKPVRLTTKEYRLLEELARHPNTVLPHDFLLRRVWGHEYQREEHYLKVFVRRLRRKLGDDGREPRYIQTEWGKGYRAIADMR